MAKGRRSEVKAIQQQEAVKATMVETKATVIRTEHVTVESNMSPAEANATKYTRRGLVILDEKQYYFSANRFGVPVVFGATSLEAPLELAKALDNKLKAAGKNQSFFKEDIEKAYTKANVYADELSDGILIIKEGNKYFGYMPGKAGCRAVCYRTGGKHYSCAVTSMIKDLDRPGKQSFRQMASQETNIAEKCKQIISILNERTSPEPTPDKPKRNRRKDSQEPSGTETSNSNNNNKGGDLPKRGRRKVITDTQQETQATAQPEIKETQITKAEVKKETKEVIQNTKETTQVTIEETKQKTTEEVTKETKRQTRKPRQSKNKKDTQPKKQIDISNDEQVVQLVAKLLDRCIKDNGLDQLLAQLTGNNAKAWVDEMNEYRPDVSEIADSFRDDVKVLLTDECYQILASAIL